MKQLIVLLEVQMIKYKYLYDNYLKEIDDQRKQLAQDLEIKLNENDREINFIKEDLRKADKAYIAIAALFAILLYPFYIFMQEYLYTWTIFIYASVFVLAALVVFIIKIVLKCKIKKLGVQESAKAQEENKIKYTKKQEEIYDICLFIITVNENYDYLMNYTGQKQKEEYEKLMKKRKDIINVSMNFKPNPEKYERYLNDWMTRREKEE